jgi:hypothetical protein
MTSTTFQDNQNLSDNTCSSLTQFIGQDGGEFVINTTTGDAFISQSAAGRVLGVSETTIRNNVKSLDLVIETAVINTPNGKRSSNLISAEDFFILAQKYKPVVAKQMLKAGANLYIYGLAGYKISISEPEPAKPQNQTLLNIEWAKAYILNQTQALNLEQFPGMKKMINHLQTEKETGGEMFPAFSLYSYLANEDCLELLDKKLFNVFNRRVAGLYRICYQKHPKRTTCVLTGKRANHYTEEDLVLIEQAFDTLSF